MTRLIDADALETECYLGADVVHKEWLDNAPTIDAVPKEKILLFLNIANEELSKAHADKSMNGIMTWSASVTTLEGLLKEYDTADTDIVPVIRCKDCKYYEETDETIGTCLLTASGAHVKGYCAWAERRGEGKCGSD